MLMRPTLFERRILDLASRHGIDTSALATGRSLLAETEPGAGHETLARIIRELRQALHDELLGTTAHPVPFGTFDVVMKSAASCRSLSEFVLELIAAAELIYSPPDLRCSLSAGAAEAAISFENAHDPGNVFYLMYGMLATHRGMSWLIDERILLTRIELHPRQRRYRADLEHLFQCTVKLGAGRNALVFDPDYLDAPIRRGAGELEAYLKRRPLDILYRPGRDRSLSGKLSEALAEHLERTQEIAGPEWAAAALQLSTSQLRRRLAREQQTFLEIKNQVRRQLAERLLANGVTQIDQIAGDLGFRETNSFYRAFKRWTGLSPLAYRRCYSRIASDRRR